MKMKRGLKLLALVGVLSLVIAACGGGEGGDTTTTAGEAEPTTSAAGEETTTSAAGETTTAPAEGLGTIEVAAGEPIKIASLQSISGETASLGTDQVRGIELAITDKAEILGHPVELAFNEDDGCSSEGGQTGSTRIIADPQVVGVIGTSCSGAGVPASNVISSAGRVLVSGSNTSPYLTSDLAGTEGPDHHPGYFRTAHNDAIQGAAAANFVFNELGLTQVASINDGDPYTEGLAGAFDAAFEALGGTVVVGTAVTVDQTDMRSVLTEIAAAGAELIFFPIFQPAADFIAEQALEVAGLEETILMGADGLLSDTFVVLPQSKGMYFSGPQIPLTDEYDAFVAAYEEAYGEPPIQSFHAHAYDATNMVFAAIETAATDDGSGNLTIDLQGVRDALHSMTHEGLTGTHDCDEFGDCAFPGIDIVQNTDETADIAAVRANVQISYSAADLGF